MALEIHTVNGQAEYEELKENRRIPNNAVVTFMTPEKAQGIIDQLEAALEGEPQLVAIIGWNDL